jgi:hypothetical protein
MGAMQSLHWLADNWFTYLNALGVVGGLCFTGYSLHSETKTRKIANLLTLAQSHREVWKEVLREPKLNRVLSVDVDTDREPVTREEEIFVTLVIQHLGIVFRAMKSDLTIDPEGLRRDVWQFFSLPIPLRVWNRIKVMQDDDFVAFVEACRNWK